MTMPLKSVKSCKKLQKIVKSAIRNNMLEVNCKTKDQKVIFTDMLVFFLKPFTKFKSIQMFFFRQ